MSHLSELRMRIVRSMLSVAIGASIILVLYDHVLHFLTQPYRNICSARPDFKCDGSLFALGPIEGLASRMRIAGYGGIIISIPVILWQLWRFIAPAMSAKEKKYSVPFIVSSIVLFAFGGILAYWTLDKALEFLISWSGSGVNQAYQISKYISLVALMVLAFGIGFLLPVVVVFLQLVGAVTPQQLVKQWRIATMAIFVIAAVITPSGDPISMLALAVPMTVLYLIAVVIGFVAQKRKKKALESDSVGN
ncbi:MAG: twin-arginine translocase subunit TatC [Actinobacteria bacterium]|nr:MAG: twin-arginine translocase subunit TatC [Actinomycetota bacterium]